MVSCAFNLNEGGTEMSAKRLSMRKAKEVLRLKWESGLSSRKIAKSCSIARATVAEYLRRAKDAGLSWPLPSGMDEAELDQRLFPSSPSAPSRSRPVPDWPKLHKELKRKGVTLFLLWQEYKEAYPKGYQYSWFCKQYQSWTGKLDIVMRQDHRAGEKVFVDYAGQTVPVVNSTTGEIRQAQIFVAVLGASNYTYAEATCSQCLPDWIGSHRRAFEFFGGVPEVVVPDNLTTAVTKSSRYEPDLNPTYQEMATHYGCAVIPTRVRKPRDKAKVEVGIQVVERCILARLRNRPFFGLEELNAEIWKLIKELNGRPFKKLPGSRQSLFDSVDKPALKPLPTQPYVYAEWKKARVNIDYHIEVDGHYYSVPYQLVKHQLDVRLTRQIVEIFHKGRRIASHRCSKEKGYHTTVKQHMPQAHQRYVEWTPERLIRWAANTGTYTARIVEAILASRAHPQQGFRSCLGIMRLGKEYGQERLEAACTRAMAIGGTSFKSIQAILKSGLDRRPLPKALQEMPSIYHPNIRGPHYYNQKKGGQSC
jgi:transposase